MAAVSFNGAFESAHRLENRLPYMVDSPDQVPDSEDLEDDYGLYFAPIDLAGLEARKYAAEEQVVDQPQFCPDPYSIGVSQVPYAHVEPFKTLPASSVSQTISPSSLSVKLETPDSGFDDGDSSMQSSDDEFEIATPPPPKRPRTAPATLRSSAPAKTKSGKKAELDSRAERMRIRQEKNRMAAKKCRERKQAYYHELELEVVRLRQENSNLNDVIRDLKEQLRS